MRIEFFNTSDPEIMDYIEIPDTPGASEETTVGQHVKTIISMEPGAAYGDDCPDSYCIETQGSCVSVGYIMLSSLDEIEEYARHLLDYVDKHRR